MFSIDLLNGKGRRLNSGPKGTLLKAVPFLIPAIVVVVWAASYRQDCSQVSTQLAAIQENQALLEDAAQAVSVYRQTNARITQMNQCLEMIAKGLSYRIQVTGLLVELAQSLPDDIFMYEMKLDRTAAVEKVKQDSTGNMKDHLVVQRKLKLTLCGFDPAQSDQWVRKYVEHLKNSEELTGVFTEVKPSVRRQGVINQQPATFYEIECTLPKQG